MSYTEEYHLNSTNQACKDIYVKLKTQMLEYKSDLKFNSTKYYVSIVSKRSSVYILFRQKKLTIIIMLPLSVLKQNIKHHAIIPVGEGRQRYFGGQCATVIIKDTSNLDEIINVLKLAINKQSSRIG